MEKQKYKITYKIGDDIKDVIVESVCIENIINNTTYGDIHFIYINGNMVINPRYIIKIEKFEVKTKKKPKNDHPGVTWDKTNGVWKVRVYIDGKQVNVGSSADFDTAMELKRLANENLAKFSMEEINRTS